VPEGHSLRLAAERLQPLVGAAVAEGPLAGARVESVEARGKNLLVHASDGRTLHVHLGMHGAVRLEAAGAGRGRHVMRTGAGDAVFRTSRVRVLRTRALRLPVGPDLLGAFDCRDYLRRARLVERPIGEMVMDQRVLAGIGNVVKSETLWRLRIDPFTPVSRLSDRELLEVAAVGRRVLRAGVAARGGLPHDVYRRAARPCPRCGAPIRSQAQGESVRRTYWCPACQTRGSG
jgi:endonuclease VIII